MSVLRWLIRLASVVATTVLAYGWGDFSTDPGPLEAVVLIVLTAVLVVALVPLFKPGGMAAFEWDEEEPERRAPGEAAPPPEVRPRPAPPREPIAPRTPSRSRPSGSLWSRDPED